MKREICLLMATVLMLCFVGCGAKIEDTNGEDNFSLTTITDENIIERNIPSSGAGVTESNLGGLKSTKYHSKNFSGVEEIYGENYLFSSTVIIDVSGIKVEKGNFRMVVLVDDEIIHDFSLEEQLQTFEVPDVNGYLSIRIAGESAAYEFHMNVF